MAAVYDDFDLSFGFRGDFSISNGDLNASFGDGLQSIKDQCHLVLASVFGDWEATPNRAAGLDDFAGEPNIPNTAQQIKDRIRIILVSAGIVADEDLNVRIMPVHIHRVMAVIEIDVIPTSFNNLTESEPLIISMVYDTVERLTFFLDKKAKFIS